MPRPKKDNLQLLRAATEVWDEDEPDIGYVTRLTQTNLPYKDPGDIPVWSRHNGSVHLLVEPGQRLGAEGTYHPLSSKDPGTSSPNNAGMLSANAAAD